LYKNSEKYVKERKKIIISEMLKTIEGKRINKKRINVRFLTIKIVNF